MREAAERAFARALKLPAATVDAPVEQVADVRVPTTDGGFLLTDMWFPQGSPEAPVVLVRTPYGRGGLQAFTGRVLARQGFRAIAQSTRGTAGSTGPFVPFVHEAADAQATVDWLRQQPWFAGRFTTYGISYAGYTQWALAVEPPPELIGMVVSIAPINPRTLFYGDGAFSYEAALTWTRVMPDPPSRVQMLLKRGPQREAVSAAASALPLNEGYIAANDGRRSEHFENWLAHSEPEWWEPFDHSVAVERVNVPVLLQGGWHDLFTEETYAQFELLRARGVDAALVMAATTHSGLIRATSTTLPVTLAWLRSCFAGQRPARSGTALAQDVGTGEWSSFDVWPPAETEDLDLYLHPGRRLDAGTPPVGPPDRWTYDPSDPTPSVGGQLLDLNAKQDNRELTARADVLSFTTDALGADLSFAGEPEVSLYLESSSEHYDLFIRLCKVDGKGRSTVICDTIRRLGPTAPFRDGDDADHSDRARRIDLSLPPTLCTLGSGHRLQLLICGGAHPRYARNTGTGEPLATARALRPVSHLLHHDPYHPSGLKLRLRDPASGKPHDTLNARGTAVPEERALAT